MTDFNRSAEPLGDSLRKNAQGCWEWERDGQTFGTNPNGNGLWRKLPKPEPKTIPLAPHQPIQYLLEWEMIFDRDRFHLPADRTGATNHLIMYYGV